MSEHTPGPWKVFILVQEAEVIATNASDVRVADVFCGYSYTGNGEYEMSESECHANARLIAAAPQLLKACKAFVAAYEKSLQLEKTDMAVRMARIAIEAAEGES